MPNVLDHLPPSGYPEIDISLTNITLQTYQTCGLPLYSTIIFQYNIRFKKNDTWKNVPDYFDIQCEFNLLREKQEEGEINNTSEDFID